MSIITIATDYGSFDGFTAAIKGVIKSLAPKAETIDVTDNLSTVLKGSLVLTRYCDLYPAGTVHLVIVDPTVGTARRALAGTDGKHFFVGPDNGVFSHVIAANPNLTWYEIEPALLPAREISNTFHGRDIFAPAAALVSIKTDLIRIGHPIDSPQVLDLPVPREKGGEIIGEVIDIDSFGNLIINILGESLEGKPKVMVGEKHIPMGKTFSDVEQGKPVAYIGGFGYLEIAVNLGRADTFFGAKVGSKVKVII